MLLLCPFVDPLQVGDTLQAGTGLLHTGPSSSHSRQASQDTSPPRDGHTKRTGPPACTHVKPLVGPCLLTSRGSEQRLRAKPAAAPKAKAEEGHTPTPSGRARNTKLQRARARGGTSKSEWVSALWFLVFKSSRRCKRPPVSGRIQIVSQGNHR